MSLEWEDVLDRLLRLVERDFSRVLSRVHVVRDLRGRLRIAVQKQENAVLLAPNALEDALAGNLGAWFAGPPLWTDAPDAEVRRLATNLLKKAHDWPDGWPSTWDDGTGNRTPITLTIWSGEERVRAKQSWLSRRTASPPWPLHLRTPAIVSFYSFKGGVGRTTLLGVVARSMAKEKEGRKVVVIDLDLEAPGAGRFFDVQTERGVLDLLVEHLATGAIDEADLDRHAQSLSFGSGEVIVFPVGRLDWSYVEKLGRLDFTPQMGRNHESPVEEALRRVLQAVHRRYAPDYILLDARAGLHDLGGLSLHALSHLDVLVGRKGPATADGFRLAIEAIKRRRRPENHRVMVAQTFVLQPLTSPDSLNMQKDWRADVWDCFEPLDQVGDGERPGVDDTTGRHYPLPVPAYESIARADRIQDIDAATLDAEPFATVRDRIHERCLRPLSPSNLEGDDEDGGEIPG